MHHILNFDVTKTPKSLENTRFLRFNISVPHVEPNKMTPDCYQQPRVKDGNQIRWMKWSPKTPILLYHFILKKERMIL